MDIKGKKLGRKLRAIDLYSGVGGWSIGLKLAGISVVSAYEKWKPAIDTYRRNLGDKVVDCDIRRLRLEDLPDEIDIVVGSPPCTQFSYSNRGGSGDLQDGLEDIEAFLRIVEHIRPQFWAMENVPRLKSIVESELGPSRKLSKFEHLIKSIDVIDMSEFGLPQRRRRCIVGDFPRDVLLSYREGCPSLNLGNILSALGRKRVHDPIYNLRISSNELTDHGVEPHLTTEEVRINRDSKTRHPVYNSMSFPERLSEPSRTLTATCTKVSRESLIIEDTAEPGEYRRLTIRERSCLQGFPCNYKFFDSSYSNKVKMVGNALPPLFALYLGYAIRGVRGKRVRRPSEIVPPRLATEDPPLTLPNTKVHLYPKNRRFRAVVPGLHFKSGIRFELANDFSQSPSGVGWFIAFLCGTPSDIREIRLDDRLLASMLETRELEDVWEALQELVAPLEGELLRTGANGIQEVWSHSACGLGPHEIVDELGMIACGVVKHVEKTNLIGSYDEITFRIAELEGFEGSFPNDRKIREVWNEFVSGLLVGCWFNGILGIERYSVPSAAE